jgi:hypothetical protein
VASGAEIGLDMFAQEVQDQEGAHDRKRYVGLTIVDVQMATRDAEWIVPRSNIQVDSDHTDPARVRQVYMELKALYGPSSLILFKLNLEFKSGASAKLQLITSELMETSLVCFQPWEFFVCFWNPAPIGLPGQICSKAA